MGNRPPNRFSPDHAHAKYGVLKYLRGLGIVDNETRLELMYVFCEQNGFKDIKNIDKNEKKYDFISNRFQKFAAFVPSYMKDNNYKFKKLKIA